MSFGNFNETTSAQPMAEINTTPLVDVMLVLLVIFIITAPLFQQAVPIDLPKVNSTPLKDQPQIMTVAIDAENTLHIDGKAIDAAALPQHFAQAATRSLATELHLRADRQTRYEHVTRVLAEAQRAGISRIAFVTDPG